MRVTIVIAAFAIALAVACACAASAHAYSHGMHRHAKLHRVLQPLAAEAAAEADVEAAAEADADASAAVGWTGKELADGVELKAGDKYHYPAADKDDTTKGQIPATDLCRDAVDAFVGVLTEGVQKEGRWPMAGVLVDSNARVVVVALSGKLPTVYSTGASAQSAFQTSKSKNGVSALAGYSIVDLNDGKSLGFADDFLDVIGESMGAYLSGDPEYDRNHKFPQNSNFVFTAAGALKSAGNGRKLDTSSPTSGDVWAFCEYPPKDSKSSKTYSKRVCASNVYAGNSANVLAQGNPFGQCAGSKLVAYARVAKLTPTCMAERMANPKSDKLRASCLTCQHVITEALGLKATGARDALLQARAKAVTDAQQHTQKLKQQFEELKRANVKKELEKATLERDGLLKKSWEKEREKRERELQEAEWWVKAYEVLQTHAKKSKKLCEEQAEGVFKYLHDGNGKYTMVDVSHIPNVKCDNEDTKLTADTVNSNLQYHQGVVIDKKKALQDLGSERIAHQKKIELAEENVKKWTRAGEDMLQFEREHFSAEKQQNLLEQELTALGRK